MSTFPTDKDQYLITDTIIRGVDCQYSFNKEAVNLMLKFTGDITTAVSLGSSYREGTRILLSDVKTKFSELSGLSNTVFEASGKVVASSVITKQGSATTTVSIRIPFKAKITPAQTEEPESRKIVTWDEKSADYEFPMEIYAGEGDSSTLANAGYLEAWKEEKTKNIDNYKNFKFSIADGAAESLTGRTLALAKKIYRGTESVRRSYPQVVRTTQYLNYKADEDVVDNTLITKITETPNLYERDQTPNAVWASKFPNFDWVKASYDVDCEPTEYAKFWNMTVTESWIGISTAERGTWDNNLYGTGTNRWHFAMENNAS